MPITIKSAGDLFQEDVDAIVNTVNCSGRMGAGIALQFAKRFPEMLMEYREWCRIGRLRPGILHIRLDYSPDLHRQIMVINFPTKDDVQNLGELWMVEEGLRVLRTYLLDEDSRHVKSLAMPALGCGFAGLHWEEVLPLIQKHLGDLPHDIIVFEPQ